MHKRPTIIKASKAAQLAPAAFRTFERRPVNYFRNMITEEERESTSRINEEEFNARMEDLLSAERKRLATEHARELEARFKQGTEKGRAEAGTEIQKAVEILDQYGKMLQAERQELAAQFEKSGVELGFLLAKKILGAELEIRPDRVRDLTRQALSQVLDSKQICLRVNPLDVEHLKAVQPDIQQLLSTSASLEIRGDAKVERGGCVIESERGLLDAQISSQLETLKSGLVQQTTKEEA